jgi:hypothetical protein
MLLIASKETKVVVLGVHPHHPQLQNQLPAPISPSHQPLASPNDEAQTWRWCAFTTSGDPPTKDVDVAAPD